MKLSKLALAFLASAMVLFGMSATAETSEQTQLNSVDEVESLLEQLGIYDLEKALEEENSVFGDNAPTELLSRRGGGGNWSVGRRRPPRRRPPHRRPPRRRWDDDDHWRRPRPRPPRYRQTICYVRNRRGQSFSGVGYSPRVAEERAARECYRYSRVCYADGCYAY